AGCAARQPGGDIVEIREVKRILNTLASDEMQGRASFTPGIERAADLITAEFKKIGLKPYTSSGYRQTFDVTRIKPATWEVTLDGVYVHKEHVIISSNNPGMNWNTEPDISIVQIADGANFSQQLREISAAGKDALVIVDTSFADIFRQYADYL